MSPISRAKARPCASSAGRDAEGEGQVGECLPVDRPRGEAVHRQHGEAAGQAPDQGDEQGFKDEGQHDGPGPEAEGPHRRDLAGPLGDGRVHRVQGGKDRSDPHHQGHEKAQEPDEVGQGPRLGPIIVGLPGDLDRQARVGRERVLEAGQGRRRFEAHGRRLEDVRRPLVDLAENVGVAPYLGVEGAAAGVEDADDLPCAAAEPDTAAESESPIGLDGVRADDELGQARLEEPPGLETDVGADGEGPRRDAPDLDVGVRARFGQGEGGDNDDLARGQRSASVAGDPGRVLDRPEVLERDGADHLGIGAGPENDRVAG